MNRTLTAATMVVASVWARDAIAQDAGKAPVECSGPLDASRVVRCALAASPEIREARERLVAIAGRRITAGVWLPSNPTVSVIPPLRN